MDNKVGLENILRAELILLSKQILQDVHQKDFNELFHVVKELHEKMVSIKVLSKHLTDAEVINIFYPESIEKKLATEQNSLSKQPVPEHNLLEDMSNNEVPEKVEESRVKHVPTNEKVDKIYKEIANISFVKKDNQKTVNPSHIKKEEALQNKKKLTYKTQHSSQKTIKEMSIGLNDRIAFINNLFEGNTNVFNATVDRLNACENYENALELIYHDIKPKYDNWEGKDQYEFRFLQLLELKFN